MRKPKIIIKKAGKNKKQFMVVIVGKNGKVLLTSELLYSKRNCVNNINAASNALQHYSVGLIKITA